MAHALAKRHGARQNDKTNQELLLRITLQASCGVVKNTSANSCHTRASCSPSCHASHNTGLHSPCYHNMVARSSDYCSPCYPNVGRSSGPRNPYCYLVGCGSGSGNPCRLVVVSSSPRHKKSSADRTYHVMVVVPSGFGCLSSNLRHP